MWSDSTAPCCHSPNSKVQAPPCRTWRYITLCGQEQLGWQGTKQPATGASQILHLKTLVLPTVLPALRVLADGYSKLLNLGLQARRAKPSTSDIGDARTQTTVAKRMSGGLLTSCPVKLQKQHVLQHLMLLQLSVTKSQGRFTCNSTAKTPSLDRAQPFKHSETTYE